MAKTLEKGDMVPAAELPPAAGERPVRIGWNRPGPQVLVITHADPCKECSHYLESFEDVMASLRKEKADVLALVGSGWQDEAESLPVGAAIAEGRIRQKLSPEGTPVVLVVDRFGQIFHSVDAGEEHEFPDHERISGTLIDMAIRCPECGVPDVPSPDFLPEEGATSGGMHLGQ